MLGNPDFHLLQLNPREGHRPFSFQSEDANSGSTQCPNCGFGRTVNIAIYVDKGTSTAHRWMVCTECLGASIAQEDLIEDSVTVYPPALRITKFAHLPKSVESMWKEANLTHHVGAYTSAALMCRKIIYGTAVNLGLKSKEQGHAPDFTECIDYLVKNGYLSGQMRHNWAGSIKDWGNIATHKVKGVSHRVSANAIKFTEQVLLLSFEYPGAAKAENESETDEAGESSSHRTVPRTSGNPPR